MKICNLKVPVSSIELENKEADKIFREKNYLGWRWLFLDEIVSIFAEGIKKHFDFSYNDYFENRDGGEYSFEFCVDSIVYLVWIFGGEDKGDSIEYKMRFYTFEAKKILFFTRRVESKRHYEKLKKVVLKIIKENNFTIFEAENL